MLIIKQGHSLRTKVLNLYKLKFIHSDALWYQLQLSRNELCEFRKKLCLVSEEVPLQ